MDGSVKNIILTACLETGRPDYEDLNTDVIVQFDNGDKYFATFMSYKNLEHLLHKGAEDNSNIYVVLNTVLVKDFNNGDLMPVIDAMLSEGDFQLVFKKI